MKRILKFDVVTADNVRLRKENARLRASLAAHAATTKTLQEELRVALMALEAEGVLDVSEQG